MANARLPLLAGQTAIWVAEQLGTLGRPYNARWSLTYNRGDATDRDVLAALQALIELHPSLRTRIGSDRGVPYQLMDRPAPVEVIHCDDTDPDGTTTRQTLADQLGSKVQNLEQDSLSEIYVISAAEQVHIVFLQHHLGFDGGTRTVLPQDLDDVIGARVPSQPDDFTRCVLASYELQSQAIRNASEALDTLADAAVTGMQVPIHNQAEGFGAAESTIAIPDGSHTDLVGASGVTRAGIAIAATLAGLAPYRPSGNTLVGLVVSSRPRPESRVAGCFVNTVPVILSSELTPEIEGAQQSQEAIRAAVRLRHFPVGELTSRARRQKLGLPRPDSILTSTSGTPDIPGMIAYQFQGAISRVTFRMWDLGDRTRLTFDYPLSVFTEPEAHTVFEEYRRTVARLAAL